MTTWSEYKAFAPGKRNYVYEEQEHSEVVNQMSFVKGHLVQLPLRFLVNENLNATTAAKESFVPAETFI